MNTFTDLKTALLDLLYETRDTDLKLIVGGGYGLFLKREYVRASGARTLLTEWPEARSTNDIDLFLRPELLIRAEPLQPLGSALNRLGFAPVPGAEKYQFARPGPTGGIEGSLKFDLLTGPRSRFAGTPARVDDRRVRPRPSVDVHAHPVDEALTLEEGLLPVRQRGKTSGGQTHEAEVYLPHPLTFAMMKLFAFRDRVNDPTKELGQYHALDLYAVLAMTTEPEWDQALDLQRRHRTAAEMVEAVRVVRDDFATPTSRGMLHMRESPYYRAEFQAAEFLAALHELFSLQ
jgi:hypothetical protein